MRHVQYLEKFAADDFLKNVKAEIEKEKIKERQYNLQSALTHLVSAANLLDKLGLEKQADLATQIIEKLGEVSSDQMLSNLKDHGTPLPVPPADLVPGDLLSKAEPMVGGKVDSNKVEDKPQEELTEEKSEEDKGDASAVETDNSSSVV